MGGSWCGYEGCRLAPNVNNLRGDIDWGAMLHLRCLLFFSYVAELSSETAVVLLQLLEFIWAAPSLFFGYKLKSSLRCE